MKEIKQTSRVEDASFEAAEAADDPRVCPVCGHSIPAGSSEGFCPSCAFVGAISLGGDSDQELDGEIESTVPGQKFGDYELIEEIGRGGMGVVFKAHQISLDRTVAVKMLLHGRFIDPAFRQRFRLEAEASAHLEHPHVVPIYEIGEHAGQPFFSMRWVDGHSLDHELMDGPLPPERCCQVIATIARAVHYAHQHGILHRDLKPHNIVVDAEGAPYLTDFGLAKLLENDTGLTLTETVLGSPGYVSPEQAAGLNSSVTTAADIFSLGAMLYVMLTGVPPFAGETPIATLHQVIECDPKRPRTIVPTLPRDLETICLKCLQKEPERRYRSAEGLAVDLERWMSNEPILARPTGDLERLRMWCRRRPWRAALAAGLIVSVMGGATGIVNQWQRAEEASREADAGRLNAERDAYSANLALALTLMVQGKHDQARTTLLAAGPEYLRGWEWGWLQRRSNRDLMTLGIAGAPINDAVFSADGRFVLTAGRDGVIRTVDLQSGSIVHELQSGDGVRIQSIALNADGRELISLQHDGTVRVWDLETQVLESTLPDTPGRTMDAALSQDGTTIATGGSDGTVRLWDRHSGDLIQTIAHSADGAVTALAFSPDGGQLAYARRAQGSREYEASLLKVLNVKTGNIRTLITPPPTIAGIAYSPDGNRLAIAGSDASVMLTDPRTDEPLKLIHSSGLGHEFSALTFSPDSRHLMVAGGSADTRQVEIIDLETLLVDVRPTGHSGTIRSVHFSPVGDLYATASNDGTIQIWTVARQPNYANLEGHDDEVWAVAVSPDGSYVASGSLDQTAKIWETATGRLVKTFAVHYPVVSVAFTTDSRHLVTNAPGNAATIWPLDADGETLQLLGHQGLVFAVAVDPTGRWIATGSRDQTVRLWDRESGRLQRVYSNSVSYVSSVAFSPDGERIAAGGMRGRSAVWETQSGRLLCEMNGHKRAVTSLAFSLDGTTIATGSIDGSARIWNSMTGDYAGRSFRFQHLGIKCIAFSHDGSRLLTTGARSIVNREQMPNKSVALWDISSGRRLWEHAMHDAATYAMAFSPDGSRIVTGGGDNTVRIWTAFPWKTTDFPGSAADPMETRFEWAKREYWANLVTPAASPDRMVQARPWGEVNLPTMIEPKTRPDLPIPVRSPDVADNLIDLSPLYNAALNEDWQPIVSYFCLDGDLTALPPGLHTWNNITFDVRGVIQLGIDRDRWDRFPKSAPVPVNRKIKTFHVIHAIAHLCPSGGDGAVVGSYRLVFADGQTEILPIEYGVHLRSFWREGDPINECARASLAWQWKEPARQEVVKFHRLYQATFENPHPETEVARIEFVSGSTEAAPFLVAMTVE